MKKVRRVALVNRKGGCGKTTSLFSIAGVLAGEKNKKVLAIDLDAQRNTTTTMLMNVPRTTTCYLWRSAPHGYCSCNRPELQWDTKRISYAVGIPCEKQ